MTKKDLYYKGKTFVSMAGFLHEIAEDLDLDEQQLNASSEAFKQAGKQVNSPEVLAAIVTHVDEQQYAVDPQQVEDICNGVDCKRRSKARQESDQDTFLVDEDDLNTLLSNYLGTKRSG
jgi:copper oxidase (laccase) domain-containing protein